MTYQPIYVTVSDNQGYCRSTSSCRGRVASAGIWVNSFFGTVLRTSVRYVDCEMIHLKDISVYNHNYYIAEHKDDYPNYSLVYAESDDDNTTEYFVVNSCGMQMIGYSHCSDGDKFEPWTE